MISLPLLKLLMVSSAILTCGSPVSYSLLAAMESAARRHALANFVHSILCQSSSFWFHFLLSGQRLDGIERRRAHGRIEAKNHANRD